MNGNIEVISRDKVLANAALKLESDLKFTLSIIHHLQDWQDLSYGAAMKFRGRSDKQAVLPLHYDLKELKTSTEFARIYSTIHQQMMGMSQFSERIKESLEDFLAVLEEYE